jgi:hypothetical protein
MGDQMVRFLIPSRRKDKLLLNPQLILEQKAKVQAYFQNAFGGTSPEEPPRVGTWRHADGSVTREEIWAIEATASLEKLHDPEIRKGIADLAARVCREMSQDGIFFSLGEEGFLVDDKGSNRRAPVIRFKQLDPATQDKMIHLGWIGIRKPSSILQILSLDGWIKPDERIERDGAFLLARHPKGQGGNHAWAEPNPNYAWKKGILKHKDLLFSPIDNGLAVRLHFAGRIVGPKNLYFSDTGANLKTHLLLKYLLGEEWGSLSDWLNRNEIGNTFFEGYRSLLNKLYHLLVKTGSFQGEEFNYAHLLLGRLMFLKYLEQRGWLGGDLHYLDRHFRNRENIYRKVLAPLFQELNRPKEEGPNREIPFLGGGLFRPRKKEKSIDLPDEFILEVFTFRDQFEFTILEAPRENDNHLVDLSTFGNALESLVAPDNNFREGAHFTPDPIANALAFEAILGRLTTLSGLDSVTLRQFCYGAINALTPAQANKVNNIIPELRIIDPAVGSGALLLSCLKVLMNISEYCHERMGYILKKGEFAWGQLCRTLVCKCLYGVDISRDAVEIARIRLLFSLSMGDNSPQPLPDLSFNIRKADSLLEEAGGSGPEETFQLDFKLANKHRLLDKYTALIEKYQNAGIVDPLKQDGWLKEIEELQKKLIGTCCFRNDRPVFKNGGNLQAETAQELPFFWKIYFADTFRNKNGFDIVIAEPPAVKIQHIDPLLRKQYGHRWDLLKEGTADLYYAFFQLAIYLAAPFGEISFMVPNFSQTASGASLRRLLSAETAIRRWVDFGETRLFSSRASYMALLFARRSKVRGKTFPGSCVRDMSWLEQASTRWITNRDKNDIIEIPYGSDPWLTSPIEQTIPVAKAKQG